MYQCFMAWPLVNYFCFIICLQSILFTTQAPAQQPNPIGAQTETFSIIIREKGTGRAIKRAEVRVGTNSSYSDPEGRVDISLSEDITKILINKKAFEQQIITVKKGDKSPLEIFLPPDEPDDEEIIIVGKKRPEASKKSVTVRETKRIAPQGDPAQITKLLPGVQSNGFSTDVIVRGSAPEDSSYFIDGIQTPSIFHQVQNLSIITDKLIKDVAFTAGGFGPQYGEATGGIVSLQTTDEIPEFANTQFKLNVPFYIGLFHESPLSQDQSVSISVRKSLLENILPRVLPKDLGTSVIPFFEDVNLRYLKTDEHGFYKFTTLYSRDGLTLSTPFDESDSEDGKLNLNFDNRFIILGLERSYRFNDNWSVSSTPYFRWSRIKIAGGQDSFYLNNHSFTLRTEFRYKLARRRYIYLGLEPNLINAEVEAKAPIVDSSDPFADSESAERISAEQTVKGYNVGAWAAVDLGLSDILLRPGIRVSYDYLINKSIVDPRLSGQYKLGKDHTLKAAIGQYSVAPSPQESSKQFGNPKLGYEISNHYVLGVESNWGKRWTSDIQFFRKRTYKLIFSSPTSERYAGTGTRLTDGFELFIRRNLTQKLFGWLAYTYSISKEQKSDNTPIFNSEYDQTHNLQFISSYRITALVDLGIRVKYTSGFPYTPVEGSTYDANLDKYLPVYDRLNPNKSRLPDSHSVDLFVTYDSLFNYWKLSYQLGIQFLSFSEQATNIQYNYDYSETEFIRSLPPIPYIQITGDL